MYSPQAHAWNTLKTARLVYSPQACEHIFTTCLVVSNRTRCLRAVSKLKLAFRQALPCQILTPCLRGVSAAVYRPRKQFKPKKLCTTCNQAFSSLSSPKQQDISKKTATFLFSATRGSTLHLSRFGRTACAVADSMDTWHKLKYVSHQCVQQTCGSGKRDDIRNQKLCPGFISRPVLAAFWVGAHIAHSFAEERARFLGRRPYVVPRISNPSLGWRSGRNAFALSSHGNLLVHFAISACLKFSDGNMLVYFAISA